MVGEIRSFVKSTARLCFPSDSGHSQQLDDWDTFDRRGIAGYTGLSHIVFQRTAQCA
ncbi:MAG TPA: hypothetical protein VM366_11360 [Anaerolineae bacterium]|nr:hypothetical protein [Anaerolineae bacterium]